MLGRSSDSTAGEHRHTVTEPGISLAKGPAMLIGLALAAAGLLGLLHNADLPGISNFPSGDPDGTTFAGIEMNGWTSWITIAAGTLLLFGAAQHHLAKVMSLLVGGALVACAVLGLIEGDVLGLAATNGLTQLIWAIVGVVLLLNTLAPRRERERDVVYREPAQATPVAAAPVAARPDSHRADERGPAVVRDDQDRERLLNRDDAATTHMPPADAPGSRPAQEPAVIRDDDDRERLLNRDDAATTHMPPADAPGSRPAQEPAVIRDDDDRERLLNRDDAATTHMPPADAPGSRPAQEPAVIRDDDDRERLLNRDDAATTHMPPADAPGSRPAQEPTVIRDDDDRERLLRRDREQ